MSETPATVLVDYATTAIKTDSRLCNLGVINRRPTTNPEARFHVHTKEPPSTPPGDLMDLDATSTIQICKGNAEPIPTTSNHGRMSQLRKERTFCKRMPPAQERTNSTETTIQGRRSQL